jgi:hypothetical protein
MANEKKAKKSYTDTIQAYSEKVNLKDKKDFGFKENPHFDLNDIRYPSSGSSMSYPSNSAIFLRHGTVKPDVGIPWEYRRTPSILPGMGEEVRLNPELKHTPITEAPLEYMENMRKQQLDTVYDPNITKRGAANVNQIDDLFSRQGWKRIAKKAKEGVPLADTFSYMKKFGKNAGKIIPGLSAVAAGVGAMGYSDVAGAATDAVIPGGLEELGVADERSIPDPRYQEYIKRMSQRKK